jgi:hypothetical protein
VKRADELSKNPKSPEVLATIDRKEAEQLLARAEAAVGSTSFNEARELVRRADALSKNPKTWDILMAINSKEAAYLRAEAERKLDAHECGGVSDLLRRSQELRPDKDEDARLASRIRSTCEMPVETPTAQAKESLEARLANEAHFNCENFWDLILSVVVNGQNKEDALNTAINAVKNRAKANGSQISNEQERVIRIQSQQSLEKILSNKQQVKAIKQDSKSAGEVFVSTCTANTFSRLKLQTSGK